MNEYVGVTQIAKEMKMSRRYILDEIERGNLKATKGIGNSYVIAKSDFEAWRDNPKRGSRQKAE